MSVTDLKLLYRRQQDIDFDDNLDTNSQILERVQSDRVTVTKPEEDRRRRTIIVEKKNGSYGFTLQSYGIHYKKEQEIEMITYVDYVDYDGPAYRAGMREGDVILSINGADMEKADHKTLVNFIKNCEARMRMVVLFEDCVRKVELHMRYIQLQRILQSKMAELEKLCLRERQLLEGNWKTHSLPARKKATHQSKTNGDPTTPTQTSYSYCRPTVSTEDVAAKAHQQKPHTPPTLILAYQYIDPHYRYMLQPSTSASGEYLLTFEQPRYKSEPPQHFIVKTPCSETQQKKIAHKNRSKRDDREHAYAPNHLCNPCIQPNSSDNTSLEAYDLASPCCDPHCVPTARRRARNHHKEHRKRDSKTEETQTDPQDHLQDGQDGRQHRQRQQEHRQHRARPHSTSSQTQTQHSVPKKYFQFGAGLVSQCSLHSCTSSELSGVAPTTTGESSGSYTTSLSTDTLYWDGSCDIGNQQRQLSVKSSKHDHQRYAHHQPEPTYIQYNPVKPKSWDNLTTKAFGGYGFGYGYLETSKTGKNHRANPTNAKPAPQYARISNDKHTGQPQYTPHTHRRYFPTNKSTESLLSVPKYSNEALSDSSAECLDGNSPNHEQSEAARFFQSPRQSVVSPTDPNFGYYSARRAQRAEYARNVVTTSSEATRL